MTFFLVTFLAYAIALILLIWWAWRIYHNDWEWGWTFVILLCGLLLFGLTAVSERFRPDGYGRAFLHSKEQVAEAKRQYRLGK